MPPNVDPFQPQRVHCPPHRDVACAVYNPDHVRVPVAEREPEQRSRISAGSGVDLSLCLRQLTHDRGIRQRRQVRMGGGVVAETVPAGHDRLDRCRVLLSECTGEEERGGGILTFQRGQNRGQAVRVRFGFGSGEGVRVQEADTTDIVTTMAKDRACVTLWRLMTASIP